VKLLGTTKSTAVVAQNRSTRDKQVVDEDDNRIRVYRLVKFRL